MKPVKEILTYTILGMGLAFIVAAIFMPEPVGVSRWGPLVFLGLAATGWMIEQWIEKRRHASSGGDKTRHPPAPGVSLH